METIMDLTHLEEKIQLKSRTDIWRLERSEGGGEREGGGIGEAGLRSSVRYKPDLVPLTAAGKK
jgi:hypothetical protein